MNIAQQLSRIINPNGSDSIPLTAENQAFIKEWNDGLATLSKEDASTLAFKNVIVNEGRCGFASGGSLDYLLNIDTGRRYRVTVRTYWRQGINDGQYDSSYTSEAGGKQLLGCTDSGSIPVGYYSRQVVGESPI